jgi:hypothetical protein
LRLEFPPINVAAMNLLFSESTRSNRLASASVRLRRRDLLAAVIVVAIAGLLRLAASWDDFWLDEIWSWQFASRIQSPVEILTKIRHDNNHFLNTWVIFTIGEDRHWFWYRLPAVVAGIGTVILAGSICWGRDRVEALTAMMLCSVSFLLVQYSSEARGYAYVAFFSLLSVSLAGRCCEQRDVMRDWIFALAAVFGFLSHLTFVFCYAGVICWMCCRMFVQRSRLHDRMGTLIRCHALPAACAAVIYVVNVRGMGIGGGEIAPLTAVVTNVLALTFGWAGGRFTSIILAWLVILAMAGGLAVLWHRRSHLAILFAVACIFAPALVIMVTKPIVLYERYFLVPSLFLLLLFAHLLARIHAHPSHWGKVVYLGLVASLMLGNGIQTFSLVATGRGQYAAAIQFMDQHSTETSRTISSDYDFRNRTLVEYYTRRGAIARPLKYVSQEHIPPAGTGWFLNHSQESNYQPASQIIDQHGNQYRLCQVYRCWGLSGWHWAVYRNSGEQGCRALAH